MEMNNKKKHLSHIKVFFIMLLFAMCLTINVLFCGNYNPYELLDKPTAIETRTISESIAGNESGNNNACFESSFLNKNNSYAETSAANIHPILLITAIPEGFSLLLFLIIVFLFFFLTLFIILPDGWTLIKQKVRLDN